MAKLALDNGKTDENRSDRLEAAKSDLERAAPIIDIASSWRGKNWLETGRTSAS